MLITGIQMMVPLVGLLIFLVISCRTISTPLFHHEFLLKKRQRTIDFRTPHYYGIFSSAVLCNLAISISIVLLSPGKMDSPKMMMGFMFS
jgi:formate/nitrite transporter FocA (FNT family)